MVSVCIRLLYSSSATQEFQRFQLQGFHFCDSLTAPYIKKSANMLSSDLLNSAQPSQQLL